MTSLVNARLMLNVARAVTSLIDVTLDCMDYQKSKDYPRDRNCD